MGSSTALLLYLVISVAIILFSILKLKINPAISLIIGSLFMGIASGMALDETIRAVGSGFGGLLGAIGIPIGFGVILGQLLSDSGGAYNIAHTLVKKTSKEKAVYAIGLSAFILSIPVFYDVTFVILIPLGIALAKETNKPIPYIVGAIAIGAGAAHTLVPPTPNPLAATSILNFDLGLMMMFGVVLGLLAAFVAMKLYFAILNRGLWKPEKDEIELVTTDESSMVKEKAPGFLLALVPILLPMLLILLGTVAQATLEEVPTVITFLSDRIIALLVGVLAAYLIASKSLNKVERDKSSSVAMKNAGIVLLVTGAGGAFGSVIGATGIGDALVNSFADGSQSVWMIIFMTYFISCILKVAQGSGTVASITTMTIMAGVASGTDIHGLWVAMAALAGGISIGHVNDSGFWVTTNLSGLSVSGGLKTYTLSLAFVSVLILAISVVGAYIF
ncbi:High-affinity gluconate transporter [Bacillus sp. THAF10]|uniref:GntP family permease n=1 Tax=Bacillus sp. THAF10 TaxID=2587848 RepID=UPI0012AA1C68|nr:SLC13 family permease [Bacillus sp. THAF10]QFT90796.1 High-affinity gluconate transporter [Bacillus sp. THAF10]